MTDNNYKTPNQSEEYLPFQFLLAELSANLVRIPPDQVDQAIQEGIHRIGEALDIDHIGLGLITNDGQDFCAKFGHAKPGTRPWKAASLMSEGPYVTQTLLSGQPFIMHDVDDLPAEAAMDREGFIRYGIRSDWVFPLIVGGKLTGGIGFAAARPRHWNDEVVRGLGLIADVFANVLERQHTVQALQAQEEQMRLAADAANIGLWVWNIPVDTIWATARARRLYGVADGDMLNLQRFLECIHPDDKQRVGETVRQILTDGSDFRDEYRVVHPDASEHWICASGHCQVGA